MIEQKENKIRNNGKALFILTCFSCYLLMSKMFFNESASVNGHFSTSLAAYQIAFLNIFFVFFVIISKLRIITVVKKDFQLSILIVYYILALISSIYSPLPIVSAYRALVGIGFYYVIVALFEVYKDYDYKTILRFIWLVLVFSFISSAIFFINRYGYKSMVFGIPSGYSALLSCVLSIYYFFFSDGKWLLDKALALFLLVISLYMKSFSANIAFVIAFMFLLILRHRYIMFLFIALTLLVSVNFGINYLESNPEQIVLGKPAGAYLIGSGRFAMYSAAFDLYYNKYDVMQKFFGGGFMAEREYLVDYNLTWSTDPHNSLITSLLGTGFFGALVYFIFILSPFLYLLKSSYRNNDAFIFAISVHLASIVYGVTSSQYIGTPSMILIITMFLLVHAKHRVKMSLIYSHGKVR